MMNMLIATKLSEDFFRAWIVLRLVYTAVTFGCFLGLFLSGYHGFMAFLLFIAVFLSEAWISFEIYKWRDTLLDDSYSMNDYYRSITEPFRENNPDNQEPQRMDSIFRADSLVRAPSIEAPKPAGQGGEHPLIARITMMRAEGAQN